MSVPARVSAGSGASSGQFASTQHAEPDINLDDLDGHGDELTDESCSHCGEDAGSGDGYDLDLNRSTHHSATVAACPGALWAASFSVYPQKMGSACLSR